MDLLLLHAAQIVTPIDDAHGPLRGEKQGQIAIIPDGGMLIKDGRIAAIGPSDEVRADARADGLPVLRAYGQVVLPALVDVHTHPLYASHRADEYEARLQGLPKEQIVRRGGGMARTMRIARNLSEAQLFDLAREHLLRMVRSGSLVIEMKTGYGLTLESELAMLRALQRLQGAHLAEVVPCFLGAHFVPPEFEGDADGYTSYVCDVMLPEVARSGLAEFCDVGCDPGFLTTDQARRVLLVAAAHGIKGRLHADSVTNSGGWRLAAEMGLPGADHLNATTDEEIRAVGARETVAVLLPAAELFYQEPRRANARLFVETGVPVAVASDVSSSIAVSDLGALLSLACVWYGLTPAEVLVASTLNAAYVVGRNREHGSLEIGKWADFWLAACDDYRFVLQRFGYPAAASVFRHGERIV